MKLSEILDEEIADIFRKDGIDELYEVQIEPLKAVLEGKNVVVAYPTASGKSLIGYVSAIKAALSGKKALYMVPLRALAYEKFEDLRAFRELGIKVGISVGDYDRKDERVGRNDIIVATSEKVDSLIRHRTGWMKDIGSVIVDEIHMINDVKRGPTLEMTVAKLIKLNPEAQIIGLSATISNSEEIAGWLRAEHFRSDWRPVSLKKGVSYGRYVYFDDDVYELPQSGLEGILRDTLEKGGQALVFVATRRYTESLSDKLSAFLRKLGYQGVQVEFGDDKTSVRLVNCLKNGVAFHHAGLTSEQRSFVEKAFRNREIYVIVATPTLAAGINLPAKTVIVRDTKRYDVSGFGWRDLPVMEVQQMLGRAGRPKYDREGYGIIIVKDEDKIEELTDRYLRSESEPIMSKLGSEDSMRMHTLALIATMDIKTEDELYSFYERAFFSHQRDISDIERSIERALEFLFDNDLIDRWSGNLRPTDFGIRTSETYIDPQSAVLIRKALESDEINEFGYLHTISLTPDMYPLYPKRSEAYIYSLAEEAETPIEPYEVSEGAYISAVKTALVLRDWIQEVPEKVITDRYGIWPGDLASRVELAEWLLTATRELSRLFRPEDTHYIDTLARRMHHGVKEDVLNLMQIRGVGRTRGRALYKSGYKHISDLRKATIEELMRVEGIGEAIARKIKEQVGY